MANIVLSVFAFVMIIASIFAFIMIGLWVVEEYKSVRYERKRKILKDEGIILTPSRRMMEVSDEAFKESLEDMRSWCDKHREVEE